MSSRPNPSGRLFWAWLPIVPSVCLTFWASTAVLSAAPTEKSYTVERGDTLSGIAHTHAISLASLARCNKLRLGAPLRPGQHLLIPTSAADQTSASSPSRPALPSSIAHAIRDADVRPGRWKHIVIHHSGVNTGTLAGMDRYHRETRHMENGLAYHFVIGNDHGLGDGEIGIGSRWTKQLDGGHLFSEEQNKVSLGICLVGNFDTGKPTTRQMDRLVALVHALLRRCNLPASAVITHQQINVVHTRCPGVNFPFRSFLELLSRS